MQVEDWLSDQKAEDLMVTKLITVWPSHTLAQVANVVLREQVSGIPVVSQDGTCRGVFTTADLPKAEENVARRQRQAAYSTFFSSDLALPGHIVEQQLRSISDELLPAAHRQVNEFMTTDLVSVSIGTTANQIIQMMVDAHVHRVLVLDEHKKLLGVITITDVLASILRAARD